MGSTREQVVELLRSGPRTVGELATLLDVTPAAVRFHLLALSQDGLVRRTGLRSTARRPAHVYELTPQAWESIPKAHKPVLEGLLAVLRRRIGAKRVGRALAEAGAALAPAANSPEGFSSRVHAAAGVLRDLGGIVDVEHAKGTVILRGHDCPLGDSALEYPEVCGLAKSLLEAIVEVPVRERCDRSGRPRCLFEIPRPPRPAVRG